MVHFGGNRDMGPVCAKIVLAPTVPAIFCVPTTMNLRSQDGRAEEMIPISNGTAMGARPRGGLSPTETTQLFGDRCKFCVGGLEIVANRQRDDVTWWFALTMGEFARQGARVTQLNAHITLFYLQFDPNARMRTEHQALRLQTLLQRKVNQIVQRRGPLPPDLVMRCTMNRDLSTDRYAMMDLLLTCPAYSTLQRLCVEAVQEAGGPNRRRPCYHISVAQSDTLFWQNYDVGGLPRIMHASTS